MPSNVTYKGGKRSRRVSRFSTKSRPARLSNVARAWPYASTTNLQMWDPFPAKATALMRYSTVITIDPSTATPGSWLFRANSIHDPDFTGVGHQPYAHDTYQSIYNHYNVKSSILTMAATGAQDGIFGVSLTDDSSVNSNYDTIRETKGTQMSVLTANAGPQQKVVNRYNCNKNFDIPYQKATSANFGASPSEGMIYQCWYEAANELADQGAMTFLVTITYIVDMWELKDLGQS